MTTPNIDKAKEAIERCESKLHQAAAPWNTTIQTGKHVAAAIKELHKAYKALGGTIEQGDSK